MNSLTDALERARELQEFYDYANIDIILLKGTHYILKSNKTTFGTYFSSEGNRNGKLTIRPYICNQDDIPSLGGKVDMKNKCSKVGDKITIINKIGGHF